MSLDKQKIKNEISLKWSNQEEKDYLLGLLEKDGAKGHCHGNVPTPASENKPKQAAKKEEPKKEEKSQTEGKTEGSSAPAEGSPQSNAAGSPGVITDQEAKEALEK